jgi:NAD(P)-dependent dehydrogenase (short-subunit alcohol dehydrogenase family)
VQISKSLNTTEKSNFGFDGKVALITGSARGIGKTIATAIGHAGAHVAICDINQAVAEASVKELKESGIDATYFATDLSQKGGPQRMISEVAEKLGRLDILVNNARAGKRLEPSEDTEENWDMTMSVGLKASYFASLKAISIMETLGGGNIVNIGSVSAFLISGESAAYHVSKSGLTQLTKYLAVHAGSKQIRVNSVLPGFIVQDEHRDRYNSSDNIKYRTRAEQCHPLKRVGYSQEVADATLFLCSEAASFITGQEIIVDGGLTIQDQWAVLSAKPPTPDKT